MNTTFILIHIFGALGLGAVVVLSFLSIITNNPKNYLTFSYLLGGGLILQALTGSLIELMSSHPSIFLVFCSKILIYLAIVAATQAALVVKMTKINMHLPYKLMSYSTAITLLAMGATGILIR